MAWLTDPIGGGGVAYWAHVGGFGFGVVVGVVCRLMGWIAVDILHDPLLKPALHIIALLERSDFIPNNALQIMGKATAGKQIGQSCCKIGVGRGVRIIVFSRTLQRLRTDESCEIGILAMNQRHKP